MWHGVHQRMIPSDAKSIQLHRWFMQEETTFVTYLPKLPLSPLSCQSLLSLFSLSLSAFLALLSTFSPSFPKALNQGWRGNWEEKSSSLETVPWAQAGSFLPWTAGPCSLPSLTDTDRLVTGQRSAIWTRCQWLSQHAWRKREHAGWVRLLPFRKLWLFLFLDTNKNNIRDQGRWMFHLKRTRHLHYGWGCPAKCGRLRGFWEEMPLWHCGNLMEPNLGNELGRCLRGPRIVIFNKPETSNAWPKSVLSKVSSSKCWVSIMPLTLYSPDPPWSFVQRVPSPPLHF